MRDTNNYKRDKKNMKKRTHFTRWGRFSIRNSLIRGRAMQSREKTLLLRNF